MTALDVVKTFLDGTFPDVGEDCPIFPVMVVLFAAALLQDTSVDTLFEFTGYRKDYVEAISINMRNNGLWKCGRYSRSGWFKNGELADENEFGRQVDAAVGCLWYSEEALKSRTKDVNSMQPYGIGHVKSASSFPPVAQA
jgi:hypothetical protein